MRSEPNQHDSEKEKDLFQDYDEFAKVLRTWFVAYGIGGPVLLLTNEAVRSKIVASGFARCIVLDFLIGVGLQVLLTLCNKTALWGCYMAEREPSLRKRLPCRTAEWFAYSFWIESIVDLASFGLFALAAYRGFIILATA